MKKETKKTIVERLRTVESRLDELIALLKTGQAQARREAS
jgi:hypothetical protein